MLSSIYGAVLLVGLGREFAQHLLDKGNTAAAFTSCCFAKPVFQDKQQQHSSMSA
jgi:hypothetical protein